MADSEPSNAVEEISQTIADEDVRHAIDVLSKFSKGGNLNSAVKHKRFRDLRNAGKKFFESFAGGIEEKRQATHERMMRNMMESRRKQLRKLDDQYLKATRLRAQRYAQLTSLQNSSQLRLCAPGSAPDLEAESNQAEIQTDYSGEGVQGPELFFHKGCYVCKKRFTKLHFFYNMLCMSCAELNWSKRGAVADLRGKVILLTGARVKIGFECGKKLLRCGATVIATSRFPNDCAERYAALPDFSEWQDRLHVIGIDLRDLKATVRFTDLLKSRYERLDAIVNNAAQTVRRPPVFYKHLITCESKPRTGKASVIPILDAHTNVPDTLEYKKTSDALQTNSKSWSSAALSQLAVVASDASQDRTLFPKGEYDINGQQIDLRDQNSWTLLLDQIEPAELVEVFAVNALSPFIICSRLKSLMTRTEGVDKFIVNVSAMEGKFYRFKGPQHPHTNMAKSALNQLVRTSAQDYAKSRIYMNAVDTGWINDENPYEVCVKNAERNWQTPIDEIDAMARVLDPIISGFANGITMHGKFLKDYHETEW